jgi:hypothetical protein
VEQPQKERVPFPTFSLSISPYNLNLSSPTRTALVESERRKMAEGEVPLLENKTVYYDNCPGCVQELKNERHRGIPYREFFHIWIITLCTCTVLKLSLKIQMTWQFKTKVFVCFKTINVNAQFFENAALIFQLFVGLVFP